MPSQRRDVSGLTRAPLPASSTRSAVFGSGGILCASSMSLLLTVMGLGPMARICSVKSQTTLANFCASAEEIHSSRSRPSNPTNASRSCRNRILFRVM